VAHKEEEHDWSDQDDTTNEEPEGTTGDVVILSYEDDNNANELE
jgi:hypothetical protein